MGSLHGIIPLGVAFVSVMFCSLASVANTSVIDCVHPVLPACTHTSSCNQFYFEVV